MVDNSIMEHSEPTNVSDQFHLRSAGYSNSTSTKFVAVSTASTCISQVKQRGFCKEMRSSSHDRPGEFLWTHLCPWNNSFNFVFICNGNIKNIVNIIMWILIDQNKFIHNNKSENIQGHFHFDFRYISFDKRILILLNIMLCLYSSRLNLRNSRVAFIFLSLIIFITLYLINF